MKSTIGQSFEVEFLSSERHQMVVIEGHVDLGEAAKIVGEEGGPQFPLPHHTWMRYTDVPEGEVACNWREVCKPNEAGANPVTLSVIEW